MTPARRRGDSGDDIEGYRRVTTASVSDPVRYSTASTALQRFGSSGSPRRGATEGARSSRSTRTGRDPKSATREPRPDCDLGRSGSGRSADDDPTTTARLERTVGDRDVASVAPGSDVMAATISVHGRVARDEPVDADRDQKRTTLRLGTVPDAEHGAAVAMQLVDQCGCERGPAVPGNERRILLVEREHGIDEQLTHPRTAMITAVSVQRFDPRLGREDECDFGLSHRNGRRRTTAPRSPAPRPSNARRADPRRAGPRRAFGRRRRRPQR